MLGLLLVNLTLLNAFITLIGRSILPNLRALHYGIMFKSLGYLQAHLLSIKAFNILGTEEKTSLVQKRHFLLTDLKLFGAEL